ncbi:MAG: glycosyltransferase [Acidobacteriota bacterium]|nr:glycosyltransferase [Acidobacteriota bacterium]
MIEGRDLVCFCNDWDGDPLSKKQIVTRLAAKNRVLWVNSTGNRNPTVSAHDFRRAFTKVLAFLRGCRTVAENISLFSPLVIPFHGNKVARRINKSLLAWSLRRALRKLKFTRPITLTFVPSSADVVGTLGEETVVYYCVDEYSQFSGTDAKAILRMEQRLIEKSHLVVVSAGKLLATKQVHNANTRLITHGVDVAHFRKACLAETVVPAECADLRGPVIGFFGLIADWVDLETIRALAVARPQWSFLLIGEVRTDITRLQNLSNVRFTGRRPYQTLPAFCKAFDVAVLPFVWNELTLAANPLKMREYLAAGLPLISTPLPEVMRLKHLVRMARTPEEYLAHIEQLIAAGRTGPDIALSRQMDAESWDQKVEDLSALIERVRDSPSQPAVAPQVA